MYTLHFKEGLTSFFLFIRFAIIRIVCARIFWYNNCARRTHMPMTSKDMERLILADGWVLKSQVGSHRQYKHPTKKGKVTIPFHTKDLSKSTEQSILKQAGLK